MDPLVPPELGAILLSPDRTRFRVWAPRPDQVSLVLPGEPDLVIPMTATGRGYSEVVVEGVGPGRRYLYRLGDGPARPDPASRWQPDGVHGPSAVVDPAFPWTDAGWNGPELATYVIYELHIGTFTPEGTFDAAIAELDRLKDLGITAVEVMPVAQFPGTRNWGYDGVYLFAVQDSYGGVAGFKRFIDACHARGLAVVLDVVYNHFGPEGNYSREFGPYFTDQHKTPWGDAVNYDGPGSDEVRGLVLANALMWQTEFHIDALRLDAVHAIKDESAWHLLAELAEACRRQAGKLNRRFHLIAESDQNDVRLITRPELGGFGLDAQWSDDFHHAAHALLTGERRGYYADFGRLDDLGRAYRDGFTYTGRYSAYRCRRFGSPSRHLPAERFVVCVQNHDQVGNRARGDRLSTLVDFEGLKLAAGLTLLSPYIPLLFMGEEYGETAPFLYFVSHSDPGLIESVRAGRQAEFGAFAWQDELPDPQAEETFRRSKLRTAQAGEGRSQVLHRFYKELLRLRREVPALARPDKDRMEVSARETYHSLFVHRWGHGDAVAAVYHFGREPVRVVWPWPAGRWEPLLASADDRWLGPGREVPAVSGGEASLILPPHSFVLFRRTSQS